MGKLIQRMVFGVTLVAAMGFGAVQAVAAPQQAKAGDGTCTMIQEADCVNYCVSIGGEGGACMRGGRCLCY